MGVRRQDVNHLLLLLLLLLLLFANAMFTIRSDLFSLLNPTITLQHFSPVGDSVFLV